MRTEAFCFVGGCRLLLIYAVTFRVSLLISGTLIAQHSTTNPGFLPPAPHAGLKSLLENLLKNPLHHHGEPSRKRLLLVTVGCLCDAVQAELT